MKKRKENEENYLKQSVSHRSEEAVAVWPDPPHPGVFLTEFEDLGLEHLVCLELCLETLQGEDVRHQLRVICDVLLDCLLLLENQLILVNIIHHQKVVVEWLYN